MRLKYFLKLGICVFVLCYGDALVVKKLIDDTSITYGIATTHFS